MKSTKTQLSIHQMGRAGVSLALNLLLFTGILFGTGILYQTFVKPMPAVASPDWMAQVNYSRTNLEAHPETANSDTSENLIDNAREKLKDTAETVREKLNLDEPISPSTKAFAQDVKEKVTHPLSGDQDLVDNESNWKY